jgi:serine protease Do
MALACLLICGPTFAQTAQDPSTAPDNPAAAQNSVKLVQVLMGLPAGAPWLSLTISPLCITNRGVQTWAGGRIAQKLPPYFVPFKTELERAGYKVITHGEDNLFDPEAGSSDYEAAAVITDAQIEGCVSDGGLFSDGGSVRGDGSMKIDWQLYSRIRKQVVARASTSGKSKLDRSVPGGVTRLITESFASNVRELAANADFRAALSAPKAFTRGFQSPGQQSKIALLGSLKAPSRHIDDAVGSVVMLVTGSGSGSGVLVSEDGYVLTNAHVVGDDTAIGVRWSDRIETLAQVVRVAKDRDVAIVKTNPRDRTPLAIKRGAVTPGQRVYAIGTPLDKAFQSSVSSGVVSANRVIDGLRYIQSDTSIAPGSSGGALLDETGSVIGIAVAQYRNDGPTGINMFIPVGDAMDFLSLEQH